ncbi:hypothetical protein NXX38_16985 [Bacteroides sp. BFG-637]|uniref:hypothetical protein n=1 Tax=Bacteroides sp. BFG-637 TaxID=2972764 RepID=UPI002165A482|nr:hypothetical protein [Bacteroides sp. BFG-637]MCS3313496.1 hypothetical protein [Bacteroides sp. BFG-637]
MVAIRPLGLILQTTNITYSYPHNQAENKYGETPKEVPSATLPAGGSVLKAKNAIGGGPMLIKDGAIKDTYVAELLKISADSNQTSFSYRNNQRQTNLSYLFVKGVK